MQENKNLDIKSPYLKSGLYTKNEPKKNLLSLKKEDYASTEVSDDLLRQKITHVSRRIVGEEIRKFSEVASREISEEFSNLEERIHTNISSNVDNSLNNKIANVRLQVGEQINQNIDNLGYEIGKELDNKIEEINTAILKVEERIVLLEKYSENLKQDGPRNFNKEDYTRETESDKLTTNSNSFNFNLKKEESTLDIQPEKKIDSVKIDSVVEEELEIFIEETIIPESLQEKEVVKEESLEDEALKDEIFLTKLNFKDKDSYVNGRFKNLTSEFEKDGFLFKKNTFTSKIKNLKATELLNNKIQDPEIVETDKEKILSILNKNISKYNIKVDDNESVESLLRKIYAEEYLND